MSETLSGLNTRLDFYVPITRVDPQERIVEGYCFVNECVEGEGGIRLLRAAMEEATPDYMKWGAVREMHQPRAVGTATAPGCGIEWNDRGAFLRALIVDKDAWEKIEKGVYKGFSLSVAPRELHNKEVRRCRWIENSLVDRPRDPDSVITLYRAEGVEDEPAALEESPAVEEPTEERVETVAEEPTTGDPPSETGAGDNSPVEERAITSETPDLPIRENLEGRAAGTTPGEMRGDTHYDCGSRMGCHGHTTRGGAQECMERGTRDRERMISDMENHVAHLKSQRADGLGLTHEELEEIADLLRADEAQHGHDSPPKGYPSSKGEYADPKNYKYPIDTEEHVRAAWSYINKAKNAGVYSSSELAAIKGRIRAAAQRFGIEISDETERADMPDAPPAGEGMEDEPEEQRAAAGDDPSATPDLPADDAPPPDEDTISRLADIERLQAENTTLTERLAAAEGETATARAGEQEALTRLAAAEERVATLEAMPGPRKPFVQFTEAMAALPRSFLANGAPGSTVDQARLLETELAQLTESLMKEPDEMKRAEGSRRISLLKTALHQLRVGAGD